MTVEQTFNYNKKRLNKAIEGITDQNLIDYILRSTVNDILKEEYNGIQQKYWVQDTDALGYRKMMVEMEKSLSDYMYYGRFKSLFGSFEKTAKYVETENFKASQNKYDLYRYVTSGNKIVKLPKDFFDSIDSVGFEDRSYNASNNYKKYLKDLFGENWRTYSVRKVNGTENPFVIAELDLPYETYLSAIKNDKDSYFDIVPGSTSRISAISF